MSNKYFRRWSVLVFLLATFLMAFECQQEVTGTSIENTIETRHLFWAVEDLVEDWKADPTLENIDTPRCHIAIEDVDLRTATEQEWIRELSVCPYTDSGCSNLAGCSEWCVTGITFFLRDRWRIVLSPGENADGHVITVRHEMCHVLLACSTGDSDVFHIRRDVFGAGGVIWR